MEKEGIKIIANNKKASYEYFLSDFLECGIVLQGTEIKSLRVNGASLSDSYVIIRNGEMFILGMNIAQYDKGNIFNHEPTRTRKLLLHKEEIEKYNKKHKRAVIIFFVFILLIYIFGKINSTVMPKALVKSDIVKLFEEYGAESVDISFDLKEDRTYITAEIDKLPKLSESNVSQLNIQLSQVKQKMNDGIYFDTEHSYDRKFETTTKATTDQYYDSYNSGGINQDAVDSAKEWANSRTTTKYRKRSYSKTTSKDRYNAKKYGNAEDFYDDNYYDFDSYEDAEDYYNDND